MRVSKVIALILALVISGQIFDAPAYASPKSEAREALRDLKRALKRLSRSKLSVAQIAALKAAAGLDDSDGDGLPDAVENSDDSLNPCTTDSDSDGVDDGDESSSSSSSSDDDSSSGGSSSSSSDDGSSSSGSSSSTSGGGSSSSTSDD